MGPGEDKQGIEWNNNNLLSFGNILMPDRVYLKAYIGHLIDSLCKCLIKFPIFRQ